MGQDGRGLGEKEDTRVCQSQNPGAAAQVSPYTIHNSVYYTCTALSSPLVRHYGRVARPIFDQFREPKVRLTARQRLRSNSTTVANVANSIELAVAKFLNTSIVQLLRKKPIASKRTLRCFRNKETSSSVLDVSCSIVCVSVICVYGCRIGAHIAYILYKYTSQTLDDRTSSKRLPCCIHSDNFCRKKARSTASNFHTMSIAFCNRVATTWSRAFCRNSSYKLLIKIMFVMLLLQLGYLKIYECNISIDIPRVPYNNAHQLLDTHNYTSGIIRRGALSFFLCLFTLDKA